MAKYAFLINSLYSGGAEKVVSTLIRDFYEKGVDIELICIEKNDFFEVPKGVRVTYLSKLKGDENGIFKFFFLLFLAFKLKNIIKKRKIEIVQSHVFRANYINILAKILGGGHKVQIVNAGRIGRYSQAGFMGRINLFLIKHLYPKADLIISKSKGMQEEMSNFFSSLAKKKVIYNPYDIERIERLSKEEVQDFEFEKEKIYIVSVGRLIPPKRQDVLIRALKKLDRKFELLLIGDGYAKDRFINLSKELSLEDRVHFIGKVKNPFKYVARSDIFVLTSKSEGFPNALVEAMICKVPVISTDCPSGPREILSPKSDISIRLKDSLEITPYGILVPIDSVEMIVKAIKMLSKDKALRGNMVINAYERVKAFGLNRISSIYYEAFLSK